MTCGLTFHTADYWSLPQSVYGVHLSGKPAGARTQRSSDGIGIEEESHAACGSANNWLKTAYTACDPGVD